MTHIGEIAGIGAAISWTITAVFFQVAARRIGSLALNLIRLVIAAVFYTVYLKVAHDMWWPQATLHGWSYLGISAIIGYVLGDFFLFKSYEYISSRTSMLIMSLSPPISALMGWLMLDERLPALSFYGMALVLIGVSIVILNKKSQTQENRKQNQRGYIYATLGMLGQGVGAVFSKIGMGGLDPFMASQMRVIIGIVGFLFIITFMKRWKNVFAGLQDVKGMTYTSVGAFFGPFLGVGVAMVSLKHIPVGVASTLMTTMPIFILAPSVLFLKEKVTLREIIGAVIAVTGIAIFFL